MHTQRHLPILIIALLSMISIGHAAGPDAYGYQSSTAVTYSFIEPDAQASTVMGGTGTVAQLNLATRWGGIYGTPVSSVRVSRHGYLSFDLQDPGTDSTADCPLPAIPSQFDDDASRIYVLHGLLTGGLIRYRHYEESPHPHAKCGVHVITWDNVSDGIEANFSFQVLLFDNLDILIQHKNVPDLEQNPAPTIGIQNATASIGLAHDCGSEWPIGNGAILITPPILTVTTAADELNTPAGATLSLREAFRDASSGTRIAFDPAIFSGSSRQKITLTSGNSSVPMVTLNSNKVIAVDGASMSGAVVIDGNDARRHFDVTGGAWLSLCNLELRRANNSTAFTGGSTTVDGASTTFIASHCRWSGNNHNSAGGAILLASTASCILSDCDFTDNSANLGGVIFASGSAKLITSHCRFYKNRARADGGVIYSVGGDFNFPVITLNHSELAMNEAHTSGGALALYQTGLLCDGVTFDNNRADFGGAVRLIPFPVPEQLRPQSTFIHCTFYENKATLGGGAFYDASPGTVADRIVNLDFCTLLRNDGGTKGGALHLGDAIFNIGSTVIADNTAGLLTDQISFDNDATSTITKTSTNAETGNEAGFAISNITDVGLTDLGYFGGFVRTCMPLTGSPLIDAATLSRSLDAREIRQTASPTSEIGAVERSPILTVTNGNASGAGSLPVVLGLADPIVGAIIRFSGVSVVTLADTNPGLSSPISSIFIEGSKTSPIIINNFGIYLSGGTHFAVHGCRLRGGLNSYCRFTSGDTSLAFDHCQVSNYRDNTVLFMNSGNRHSASHSSFERNLNSEIIRGSHSTIFLRDTLVANNVSSGLIQSSVLRIFNGLTYLQRSSIVENEFWTNTSVVAGIRVIANSGASESSIDFFAEDTTIANNSVTSIGTGQGAGLYFTLAGGPLAYSKIDLNHCTITGQTLRGDSDTAGIGFFTNAGITPTEFSIKNSIIAENQGINVAANFSPPILGGGNLTDTTFFISNVGDVQNTDPKLSGLVLGQNGCYVRVPRPGSPAINTARTNVSSTDFGYESSLRDGRNGLRAIDGADKGAAEAGRIFTVTTTVDENNGLGAGAGDSLREVLAQAPAYGTIGVGFAPALKDATFNLNSQFALSNAIVDIDDAGLTMNLNVPGFRMFVANSSAAVSVHGAKIISTGGALRTSQGTVGSIVGGDISGATFNALLALDDSAIHMADTWLHQVASPDFAMSAAGRGKINVWRSAITNCSGTSIADSSDFAQISLNDTTVSHNTGGADTVRFRGTGSGSFDAVTFARNGGAITAADANTRVDINRSILHNNASASDLTGTGTFVSLGHNLSEKTETKLNATGDIHQRGIFLAPLSDYNADGVPEMPPLAIDRVAFDKGDLAHIQRGAFRNHDVITVNLSDDQNNMPAGAFISLREAIRDVPDGGTVVFDPSLSDELFNLVNGEIYSTKSVRIDATRLPNGIRITGNQLNFVKNHGFGIFGVGFQNMTSANTTGGAIEIRDGATLALAHSSFQNCTAALGGAVYGIESNLIAENCSFSANTAINNGGAIFGEGGNYQLSYCAFNGNTAGAEGGAISGINSAVVNLLACNFGEGNLGTGGDISNVEMILSGTAVSRGFNFFSDQPAFAVGEDKENQTGALESFGSLGGWARGFQASTFTSAIDFTDPITPGTVPPPWLDARGYPRIVNLQADVAALESGAGTLDTDADGIPDWWENFYGYSYANNGDATANDDGDGATNLVEFMDGTDPLVSDNFPQITTPAVITRVELVDSNGPKLRIFWIGQNGSDYQFQSGTALTSWSNLGIVTATGVEQTTDFPYNAIIDGEFFRLRPVVASGL